MNQTKSKGASMCAKKKNNKSNKKKKKKSMLCYAICLSMDHRKRLFLSWWLKVDSEPPPPTPSPSPPSSSSSPPLHSCRKYSVNSSLRLLRPKDSIWSITTHGVRKRTLRRMQNKENNMCLTYIIRREPVKVSSKRGDPHQVHCSPLSNKTTLHDPELKIWQFTRFTKSNLQDDSLQDSKKIVYKI